MLNPPLLHSYPPPIKCQILFSPLSNPPYNHIKLLKDLKHVYNNIHFLAIHLHYTTPGAASPSQMYYDHTPREPDEWSNYIRAFSACHILGGGMGLLLSHTRRRLHSFTTGSTHTHPNPHTTHSHTHIYIQHHLSSLPPHTPLLCNSSGT